jgi:hypothetical protein
VSSAITACGRTGLATARGRPSSGPNAAVAIAAFKLRCAPWTPHRRSTAACGC